MGQKLRQPTDPPVSKKVRGKLEQFLSLLETGESQASILRSMGQGQAWLSWWIQDEWFRPLWQAAKEKSRLVNMAEKSPDKMGFIEFREKILGRHTFPHMKQWAEWFESDENDHILILCPPETAKTTTVLDYILWLIYINPEIRVGYVSYSLPHSIKQCSKLKNTIEQNHAYEKLCGGNLVPGPGDPHPWTASSFTVAARAWSPGQDEADYTVAAFGSGSQITGSRFDLLIYDDPDKENLGRADREKVWNNILQAGETRLGVSGRMIIIGNRQAEEDVYRLILDQWTEDPDLWAVYAQKAVTSWTDVANGQYPEDVIWVQKFGLPKKGNWEHRPVTDDGPWDLARAQEYFSKKQRRLGHRFYLVYQNDPLADRTKDFTREMMESAFRTNVVAGRVPPGSIVICSMDPAPTGGAAVIVYALLPPNAQGIRHRQVIDFEWGVNWRQPGVVERIIHYGNLYHPKWWAIERSATTKLFLEDPTVLAIIRNQGAFLYDLTTGRNKEALDFGVSSLRELFIGEPTRLILPGATPKDKEVTKILRDQLVDYHPETSAAHDGPMALWFAERLIKDKNLLGQGASRGHNRMGHWTSPYGGTKFNNNGSWSFRKPEKPAPVLDSNTSRN